MNQYRIGADFCKTYILPIKNLAVIHDCIFVNLCKICNNKVLQKLLPIRYTKLKGPSDHVTMDR